MSEDMEDQAVVEVEHVSFSYTSPPAEAVRDVTFSLPKGAFLSIVGPNGSGKSTLINLIMGLLVPEAGQVRVMGYNPAREPTRARRFVGYVPQHGDINLAPPLTVREVVGVAADLRASGGLGAGTIADRVHESLQMVQMDHLKDRPFKALSGGQRQRTLLARALVVDPQIFILDEPFSTVDAASQRVVSELLHKVCRENDVTIIVVVHDVNPICHYITHALLLNNEQVAFGTPDQALSPETLQRAYGTAVPVLVCEQGYQHPVVHS